MTQPARTAVPQPARPYAAALDPSRSPAAPPRRGRTRTGPTPRASAWAAGLLGLLAACGGEPPAGDTLVRPLTLERVTPLEAPHEAVAVHQARVPADLEPWTVEGTEARVVEEDGTPLLELGSGMPQSVHVPLPEDLRPFNRAVLVASFRGRPPHVFLRLHGPEGQHYEQDVVVPAGRRGATPLLFSLKDLPTDWVAVRAEIVFGGQQRATTVHALDLLHEPLALTLPQVDEPAAPLPVGLVARHGWGVLSSEPVRTEFHVDGEGYEFGVAVSQPEHARALTRRPRVHLTLSDDTGRTYAHEETLENDGREGLFWHDLNVPLDRFAGQDVVAELRYEVDGAADDPALLCVGDLRLQRRGSDTRTVLMVTSDTHRGDHVGCLRRVDVDTPVLDDLAARGVRFDGAWASTCITSPSHSAILTGVHPRDSRLVTNFSHLVDEAVTVAERFRESGFRTLAAVSVRHLGPRGTNATQGFDRVLSPTGPPWPAEMPVDQLRQWLEVEEGLPVFLWLHVFDAHVPHEAPQTFRDRYWPQGKDPRDPSLPELDWEEGTYPKSFEGLRDLDWAFAQYRAEVSHVDAALGQLLAVPRVGSGVVAFTADHGEVLAKQGSYFNHSTLFPDTLHVPLVLTGPDVPAGEVVDGRVDQLDLGRTLLDLSGLTGTPFPGRNLLISLEDPAVRLEPRFGLSAFGHSASVTHDRWHLILNLRAHGLPLPRERAALEVELYDLVEDPECEVECWREHPEVTRDLVGRLLAWLRDTSDSALASTGQATNQEMEDLLALGYSGSLEETESKDWVPAGLTVDLVLEAQPKPSDEE